MENEIRQYLSKSHIERYCENCKILENSSDELELPFSFTLKNFSDKSELSFSPVGNQGNFSNGQKAKIIVLGFCTSNNAKKEFAKNLKETGDFNKSCRQGTFYGGGLRINLIRIFLALDFFYDSYGLFKNIDRSLIEKILAEYRNAEDTEEKIEEEYSSSFKSIFNDNAKIFYTQLLKCCLTVNGKATQKKIINVVKKNPEVVKRCVKKCRYEIDSIADKDTIVVILGETLKAFLCSPELGLNHNGETVWQQDFAKRNTIVTPHPSGNNSDRITIFSNDCHIGKEQYSTMFHEAMKALGNIK